MENEILKFTKILKVSQEMDLLILDSFKARGEELDRKIEEKRNELHEMINELQREAVQDEY
jgi:hypothetical protein